MRLKDYDQKDGKRVWLSDDEMSSFIEEADTPRQRVAFLLMGRAGLRRNELVQITPADLVSTSTGDHVRVWEDTTKSDTYREPPVPQELANIVQTLAFDLEPDDEIVDSDGSTVYRWVQKASNRRRAESGDEGWKYVGPHDLRRTWGTYLLEQGVLPTVVMEWGGWEDWETFREHYLGEFSPEAIRRERSKVSFLGGDPENHISETSDPRRRDAPTSKPHYAQSQN